VVVHHEVFYLDHSDGARSVCLFPRRSRLSALRLRAPAP
jgi:predicted alpha/beta hydrolase